MEVMRRWVRIEDGLLIKVLLRNDRLDDMLFEINRNLIISDSLIMLGGDENSVYTKGNHGTILIMVLSSDLSLTIGPQPRAGFILPNLSEAGAKLGRKNMA